MLTQQLQATYVAQWFVDVYHFISQQILKSFTAAHGGGTLSFMGKGVTRRSLSSLLSIAQTLHHRCGSRPRDVVKLLTSESEEDLAWVSSVLCDGDVMVRPTCVRSLQSLSTSTTAGWYTGFLCVCCILYRSAPVGTLCCPSCAAVWRGCPLSLTT